MNFSVSALAAGFVFGVFGWWLIKVGRKDAHIPSVFIGAVLIAYPYFIENVYLLWGIGAGLLFLAYRMSRQ